MRTFLLVAAVAMLLAACSLATEDRLRGSYVHHAEGDYSLADDTLVVSFVAAQRYEIVRRTGFNLIRAGRMGNRQHETENWSVSYDPAAQLLLERLRGKRIRVELDRGMLIIGNREYRKIKP